MAGSYIYNSTKDKRERIGRLLNMHANRREDIKEVYSGDIAAAVGLKNATTGDTLCDEMHPVILEAIEFPEPVISIAIEPKTKADQEKLGLSLQKLATEDPSFRVRTDVDTGRPLSRGMGNSTSRSSSIVCSGSSMSVPTWVDRRWPTKRPYWGWWSMKESSFARPAGMGSTGRLSARGTPTQRRGFEFVDALKGGKIPREFIRAVQGGVQGAMETGIVAGFPVVDVKVTLLDGSYHEVDSSGDRLQDCIVHGLQRCYR